MTKEELIKKEDILKTYILAEIAKFEADTDLTVVDIRVSNLVRETKAGPFRLDKALSLSYELMAPQRNNQ